MSKQSKSNSLHACKYHDGRHARVKCDECGQLVCDQCIFEWSKFYYTKDRVLLGGGGIQTDHWMKMKVCPHCFVGAYIHPSKKERDRYRGIRGFLSGKSREFQRAKLIINNWEQRMLAKGREVRMLCKGCDKAWHSSKYETCFECACKKQPELLESYKKIFEHPWCKKEFKIYGDPREEYLRMPKNPSAICVFFRCRDSRKCDVRFAHDPSTRITCFDRGGDCSMPTAFVLIRTKKDDAGAVEYILQALRKRDAVKEAYRFLESQTYVPMGYTVMAMVRVDTIKELKSFLNFELKFIVANRVESNPEALIWSPS